MEAYIFKLNGWPETFDERLVALSDSIDELTVIRSKPLHNNEEIRNLENTSIYNVYPKRGSFVPGWLKPIVFLLHVIQAVLIGLFLVILRRRRPDVIHALDYILGGFAALIVSKLFFIPLVVSVRGLKEPRYRNMVEISDDLRSKTSFKILKILSRIVLSQADHIITKAEYQKQAVQDLYGINPGFTTVPTGVDFEKFNPDNFQRQNISSILTVDNSNMFRKSDKIFMYLGKMVPDKGVDRLLKHIAEIDNSLPEDVKFLFVGEFRTSDFKDEVQDLIQNLNGRVFIYPEYVEFEKVPKLIASVDALMLFSEPGHEGVPRILQESCAMETPIIVSDVTGIREAFQGLPGCYLIDRDDSEMFFKSVIEITKNKSDMEREVFRLKFDMYQNYSKYAEVYRKLD